MKKMFIAALAAIACAVIEPKMYGVIMATGIVALVVAVVYNAISDSARR